MAGKTFRMPATFPKFVPPQVDFTSGGAGDVFYQMKGMGALIENIGLLPTIGKDAAGYELANIAADIITDAKEHYVPYRFGHLRDSADSDEYVPNATNNIAEIGMWFGAPAGSGSGTSEATTIASGLFTRDPSVYAEVQHEDTSFEHPVVGPVSAPQDHYLEKPYLEMVPQVLPRVSAAVSAALNMNQSFVSMALNPEGEA